MKTNIQIQNIYTYKILLNVKLFYAVHLFIQKTHHPHWIYYIQLSLGDILAEWSVKCIYGLWSVSVEYKVHTAVRFDETVEKQW